MQHFYTRLKNTARKLVPLFIGCFFMQQAVAQVPGNALNHTGSEKVTVTTSSLTVTGSFTVEAWVMPQANSGAMTIFATRVAGGDHTFDMKLDGDHTVHGDIGDGVNWITTSADVSLAAATYNVTVMDANGCIVRKNLIVNPPATACGSFTGGTDPTSAGAATLGGLKVKVTPNPAIVDFNLEVVSGDTKNIVELRVMDMTGKVVYQTRGSVYDMFRFGRTFAAGMYVAEVLNGKNNQRVKLVKGN